MTKEQVYTKYRLLNEKEFSEITGIPISTLREGRIAGSEANVPPHVKRGSSVRYTLAAYEVWLEKNTVSKDDLGTL